MPNTEEKNYIFGIRAIIEAVNAGKTIDKLFIQKGLHNDLFAELWKLVRLKRINYKHVPLEKINRLTRKNHQGVFAFISPIDFHNIEDVVPALYEQGKNPLILVLDRITYVRNNPLPLLDRHNVEALFELSPVLQTACNGVFAEDLIVTVRNLRTSYVRAPESVQTRLNQANHQAPESVSQGCLDNAESNNLLRPVFHSFLCF